MQEALAGTRTGADLVALRVGYGLTQIAVATEMKLSRVTLNRWEKPDSECKPLRWLRYDAACRRILTRELDGSAS